MMTSALLALEDGSVFKGLAIGAEGVACGEVVFNTSHTGYQETLTDPSYASQLIAFTHPHIGNVGVNNTDQESSKIWPAGLIIRDLSLVASNWRSQTTLDAYLKQHKRVGISEIDTRRLTRIIREKGAQNACIIAGSQDVDMAVNAARRAPKLSGLDLVKDVSTKTSYTVPSIDEPLYHLVVYDFGVKKSILSYLSALRCHLTVVPADTAAAEVLKLQPDGVVLSNGPGDPAACHYAIEAVKQILLHNIPMLGICLGHQILGLANGATTIKMFFGHHGANHPVLDLDTEQVFITTQNHGFAIDEATLPSTLRPTHRSLFDHSLQGIECIDKPALGFQGHPEASPGCHDMVTFFERFLQLVRVYVHAKKNRIT